MWLIDSPTGPFTDTLEGPLWRESFTNDPCLFIDDDDKDYIYFYGSSDYLVGEMADDLLSIKGDFYNIDIGGYEPKMEGPAGRSHLSKVWDVAVK